MSYLWVDDKAHSAPNVMRAGNAAFGLLVRCASWSCDQLTDGHIPLEVVRAYGTAGEARRLVDAGLWTTEPGGYVIPGFTTRGEHLMHGQTRDRVLADRAAAANRQRRHRNVTDVSRRDTAVTSPTPHPDPHPSSTSPDNDDSQNSRALHPSSSSSPEIWSTDPEVASAIELIARAVRIACHPAPAKPRSYERATFATIVDEHAATIRQRLTAGETPLALAAEWSGGAAYAITAMRELHPQEATR